MVVGLTVFSVVVLVSAVLIWWIATNNFGSVASSGDSSEDPSDTTQDLSDLSDSDDQVSSSDSESDLPIESVTSNSVLDSSVVDDTDSSSDDSSTELDQDTANGEEPTIATSTSSSDEESGENGAATEDQQDDALSDDWFQPWEDSTELTSADTETTNADAEAEGSEEPVHDLEFSFEDDSWVQVTDASGTMLVNAAQQAGTTLTLDGDAPFDVALGNAPAVTLKFQGEEVDIDDHTEGNTARFTLH